MNLIQVLSCGTKEPMARYKPRKDAVLRARCEPALREEIEQIARANGLDGSDILRAACRHYIARLRLGAPGLELPQASISVDLAAQ